MNVLTIVGVAVLVMAGVEAKRHFKVEGYLKEDACKDIFGTEKCEALKDHCNNPMAKLKNGTPLSVLCMKTCNTCREPAFNVNDSVSKCKFDNMYGNRTDLINATLADKMAKPPKNEPTALTPDHYRYVERDAEEELQRLENLEKRLQKFEERDAEEELQRLEGSEESVEKRLQKFEERDAVVEKRGITIKEFEDEFHNLWGDNDNKESAKNDAAKNDAVKKGAAKNDAVRHIQPRVAKRGVSDRDFEDDYHKLWVSQGEGGLEGLEGIEEDEEEEEKKKLTTQQLLKMLDGAHRRFMLGG